MLKCDCVQYQYFFFHFFFVLLCKDGDISIRRRALGLVNSLVNNSNVEKLVMELVSFLPMAQSEFKKELTEKICLVVHK